MSQAVDDTIPSRQELLEADPEGFVLQIAHDQGLHVSLLAVTNGTAMSQDYAVSYTHLTLPTILLV